MIGVLVILQRGEGGLFTYTYILLVTALIDLPLNIFSDLRFSNLLPCLAVCVLLQYRPKTGHWSENGCFLRTNMGFQVTPFNQFFLPQFNQSMVSDHFSKENARTIELDDEHCRPTWRVIFFTRKATIVKPLSDFWATM